MPHPYRPKHTPALMREARYLRRRWHATYREIGPALVELHPELESLDVATVHAWANGRLGSVGKYPDGRRRRNTDEERRRDRERARRRRARS